MDTVKRNVLIIIAIIIILSVVGLCIHSLNTTYEFDEFSIEVPLGTDFVNMTSFGDETINEMYRANGEDLTITSFDKKYIEDTYFKQTGKHIDYSKGLYENFTATGEITQINDNLTRSVITSDIDGYSDTDVACLYIDDGHVIIVEGGDIDFVTQVGDSIKILQ